MIFEQETLLAVVDKIISWPVAFVIAALIFRSSISNLLADAKRVKIAGSEIERFDRTIKDSERLLGEMELVQIALAEAALAEMRAVEDSPYAPAEHKPAIRERADVLEQQIQRLLKHQEKKHANP